MIEARIGDKNESGTSMIKAILSEMIKEVKRANVKKTEPILLPLSLRPKLMRPKARVASTEEVKATVVPTVILPTPVHLKPRRLRKEKVKARIKGDPTPKGATEKVKREIIPTKGQEKANKMTSQMLQYVGTFNSSSMAEKRAIVEMLAGSNISKLGAKRNLMPLMFLRLSVDRADSPLPEKIPQVLNQNLSQRQRWALYSISALMVSDALDTTMGRADWTM